MKIRTDRNELADIVRWAQSAINVSHHLPQLNGVLLEAADGRLTVKATDLEAAAYASIGVTIDEPGVVLAPRRFGEVLARMPSGTVTLTVDDRLNVVAGRARAAMKTLNADDYPQPPAFETDAAATISGTVVDRVAQMLAPIVWTGADKPHLTGIRTEIDTDGTVTFIATDSYRMAIYTVDADTEGRAAGIIPTSMFTAGTKLDAVHLGLTDRRATLAGDERQLDHQLIEGTYPNLAPAFDGPFAGRFTIDREPMLEILARAAGFASAGNNVPTILHIDGESIEAVTDHDGEQLVDVIDTTADGPIQIGFHAGRLAHALRSVTGDTVHVDFNGPNNAVLITADGDTEMRCLVMPMNLAKVRP